MAPTLYMFHGSPPVRAVLITAKELGITLNIHGLSFARGDLFTADYLKLNPQHTVPTLDDDGKIISDSHAINAYLVAKYGKDDSLYPKDLYKRALVDQRLHFDSGVLFPIFKSITVPLLRRQTNEIPSAKIEEVKEAYRILEIFLEQRQWVAADCLTIADFSCMTVVTCLDILIPLDQSTYPNVTSWMKRVQALPCCHMDHKELGVLKGFYERVVSSSSKS